MLVFYFGECLDVEYRMVLVFTQASFYFHPCIPLGSVRICFTASPRANPLQADTCSKFDDA